MKRTGSVGSNMGWFNDLMLGEWKRKQEERLRAMQPTELNQTITENTGSHAFTSDPKGTWVNIRGNSVDAYTGRPSLCSQLMMRLDPTGKREGIQLFEFIQVHQCRDDMYAVFVVKNGKPLIIEDGDLFPSDTLITQLRLLMG